MLLDIWSWMVESQIFVCLPDNLICLSKIVHLHIEKEYDKMLGNLYKETNKYIYNTISTKIG